MSSMMMPALGLRSRTVLGTTSTLRVASMLRTPHTGTAILQFAALHTPARRPVAPLTQRASSSSTITTPATRFAIAQRRLYSTPNANEPKDTKKPLPENPSMGGGVGLKELGISPAMRTIIYVIIGILGTIETWVWCKAAYRWWFGAPEEQPQSQAPTSPSTETKPAQ